MRRVVAVFIFLLSFLFFIPKAIFAAGEFSTDVAVEYKVEETGTTLVTHTITIENLFSNLYATSYTLALDNIEPQNVRVFEGAKNLNFNLKTDGSKTSIAIEFAEAMVGKGKTRTFNILFEESDFAVRTGEVWEISIPRLSADETFRSYKVSLSIPNSFGNEAYVSPSPMEVKNEDGRAVYVFDKASVQKTGVTAGFGAFQVFSFTLNYHLENPLAKTASVDIAIPPDTALQRVYYQLINPKPENVYVDADGNWLATYILKPRQRIDVEAKGSVQIFAGPRPFPKSTAETLAANLKPTEFWQSDNPQIKELATNLGSAKAIYDYVWQNLAYDYERVRPNVERLGAVRALASPQNAICMEFTDLFIALARSAGIPAREINGFAYTENPEIRPLSLREDILHAWPEYYDQEKRSWIPVDPTWKNTTQGIDYFSRFDLNHVVFVIHGKSAQFPYPAGFYKISQTEGKDINIMPSTLDPEIRGEIEVVFDLPNEIPTA